MPTEVDPSPPQAIHDEIADLERRLHAARARLNTAGNLEEVVAPPSPPQILQSPGNEPPLHRPYAQPRLTCTVSGPPTTSSHHFLLLLSDSALPLGSFAFSSGLESYLAHSRRASSFPAFLELSLSSYASTTLPFVLAAHRNPARLVELDDALDAAVVCTVGRRASVAQGRALLSIWDRSFSSALLPDASSSTVESLKAFSALLRSSSSAASSELPAASAHLGPLFGAIAGLLGMTVEQTAYVFMLSHVKALLSAAVRASIFGPYHAQKVLASAGVRDGIADVVSREWNTEVEDAGQSVPVMDLWIGRHEMLYSRIFNS